METQHKGLRFNNGKLRYDLVHAWSHEQMVKVLTKGSLKYSDRNWEKGMAWSNVISSLKRHLAAIEGGEDYDPETLELHAAHLACNAHFLTAYYKIYPQGDDRPHNYLSNKKVGIDLDGIIVDFNKGINLLMGKEGYEPVDWQDPYVTNCFKEVKKDPEFWANLEPLVSAKEIPFQPHCYITARSVDEAVTKEWLHKHGFADVPLYCVKEGDSKVAIAKEAGIDYFIDDYMKNFVELNSAGICTFLMTRSWNSKYDVGYKRVADFQEFNERFLK